ncbi:odorant receptor 59a-like [Teleopsis dalmanni]|uniref:odorant receptor 59a-like n=1 Tax=Teleopsis dalmanni TaxID=139649 RepID=UPI0018CD3B6E|nr:odorant receptor 59a-like [Teleopsis dalmanni]
MVTILYPLHLSVLIFRNDKVADDIKNLAISVTTIACSIKFMSFAVNLKKMLEIEKILDKLDARITSTEEHYFYHNKLNKKLKIIIKTFALVYAAVALTAEMTAVIGQERILLYPGWFPFDWKTSNVKYLLAHSYQFVGICIAIAQNYANETIPVILLCLLTVHIKLLAIRISKCCDSSDNLRENEREFLCCIQDQINLYKLCDLLEELIAFPMFVQITVSAVNICVAMAALLFYLNDYFNRVYYFVYICAMILQIFPTCYFSTDFQLMFDKLPYAAFSSKWFDQTEKYKKHMILFTERALMKRPILAGRILQLDLNTYIAACKATYSLFAVFLKLKG